jgi:cell division GTPase FtsZ
VKVLLLSTGGGGGNILRSVKALFDRDLAVTEQADRRYAERLRQAVTTRFVDTNEFSLADVPPDERLIIGPRTTGRLGARHNPDVARQALEESRHEVEALLKQHAIVILIGTGGKGTGAGTMFPLAVLARQQRKLVLPIFVRPSFERHEVEKRRYDHALKVIAQFDAGKIRLMEILNDRGYTDSTPQPQSVVWERMNVPIARGLRGLIYVLWELSQIDPSDLSTLFAGEGRLRLGYADIDADSGLEPSDAQVAEAARRCWENPYYAFSKPAGTSLICIQGEWSNVVDAKIKGQIATLATGGKNESPYTPLYARASASPKPWGVTLLSAEYTGAHQPIDIDWSFGRDGVPAALASAAKRIPAEIRAAQSDGDAHREPAPPFASFWEFAVALNKSNPKALALAGDGVTGEIPVDAADVRKLLDMMWFRPVMTRLSPGWRARLFDVLRPTLTIQDQIVKTRRGQTRLSELDYAELCEALGSTSLPEASRPDVRLLVTIGRLWGPDVLRRIPFREPV